MAKENLPFSYQLVLNQWIWSLFGLDSLNGRLEAHKKEAPILEVFRERFQIVGEASKRDEATGEHEVLMQILQHGASDLKLTEDQLREYDRNIKAITERLNESRKEHSSDAFEWKYFQYLMLMFTEVYLDWFFNRPDALLQALNERIDAWNEKIGDWKATAKVSPIEKLDDTEEVKYQLNKVAFWSATGSGKTLIMHANILQYLHYLKTYANPKDINKVILLTPNEGLSRQHLEEFELSGINASEFRANQGEMFKSEVVVIDIHKLEDEGKDKTISTASLLSNNLLLVDEGHLGTASGGGKWLKQRNALCEKGFSFEYSATFAQSALKNENIRQDYTKSILFDYSYRHFYADGYGKQSQILNIDKGTVKGQDFKYHMASLLAFYQQLVVFSDHETELKPFNIEKPLWVFVSSSVTKGFDTKEANDMVLALQFINQVLTDRNASETAIHSILTHGFQGAGGTDYLHGRFNYLKGLSKSAQAIYDDLLERVFNSAGGHLYLENIVGEAGEIALRAGTSDKVFGVINVGDDAKLIKLCEEHGLASQDCRFKGSLFNSIKDKDSTVNLLFGSKRFSAGWNSWRVSCMTLLNVGKNNGAQIIQLFGRGVRLKGWQSSLKRSAELMTDLTKAKIERPKSIYFLETLNIFGVNADYVADFKKELEKEEIPVNEGLEEFVVPLKPMRGIPSDLNVIRLKEDINGRAIGGQGSAFSQLAEQVLLKTPNQLSTTAEKGYFVNPARIVLDWFPQVKGFATDGSGKNEVRQNSETLSSLHLAMLDWDRVYFDLQGFKRDKRWHNLNFDLETLQNLLNDVGWYVLYAPPEIFELKGLINQRIWHQIAVALLKKYVEAFYTFRRKQWESDKLEFVSLTKDQRYLPNQSKATPNGAHHITLDRVRHEHVITQLNDLNEQIKVDDVAWHNRVIEGMEFLWCERHAYQPLIAAVQGLDGIKISPVQLNKGEMDFVKDIQAAFASGVFDGFDVFLLRNVSGQDAVGFFIEGGFQPDFILWLKNDHKQHIVFIDPKGLRNLTPNSSKVRFFEKIKETEALLHKESPSENHVQLDAFLISNTPAAALESDWEFEGQPVTQELMESWNILFAEDPSYIQKLMNTFR
ncbi:DEAD/DEAH box helicase family protein [Thiomicrorhabdus sp. zzn3]|uniref:DEAD/DEAH box helicase family protein n=1 Tax=Thiomicrorhabdus sp. zzn3 TaxID=3039775 RepID=UPI002436DCB0|nr:DEAD/DEAH box helicase family protein [Thiomicrorhabdus sp. zzn3]MDG6778270.1 DEAD/DEAH box helicase family protein [Thiomicrorhabdus sp. zzn3]